MQEVTRHLVEPGEGGNVELFHAPAPNIMPAGVGAILFVHGNQGGRLTGAKEVADSGVLQRFSSRFNIAAAAVSQPGFGASDGPADFCGPGTHRAIHAALSFLKEQPSVDPGRIVLYGNSRGAIASAMVATQVTDLRSVILASGIYDLKTVFAHCPKGLRQIIEAEAGLSNEAFQARSALHHVQKFRSEVLLMHGKYDDRAPVTQAETFSDALSVSGVSTVLSVFECGHRIPREQAQGVLGPYLARIFDKSETFH